MYIDPYIYIYIHIMCIYIIYNVNPGLINPRLFIKGGYHFTSPLLLFGGTTTINQPGFINPGLTLYVYIYIYLFSL